MDEKLKDQLFKNILLTDASKLEPRFGRFRMRNRILGFFLLWTIIAVIAAFFSKRMQGF